MKRGIRRIAPAPKVSPVNCAEQALDHLRRALGFAKLAGACYTSARIRRAISSAKGAVRAAHYREGKL